MATINTKLPGQSSLPRKPERANGVARYNLLVNAVKKLIETEGVEGVTIQAVANQAGVPMPSVYHFFPNPRAACIAAAETFLNELYELLEVPPEEAIVGTPDAYLKNLETRAITYYNNNAVARRLMLGAECGWRIRQIDLENNRKGAMAIMADVEKRFGTPGSEEFLGALTIGITIVDSIWGLSVAHHDEITDYYRNEAHDVLFSYLGKFIEHGGRQPEIGSIS